jgi:hypothetical protein
VTGVAVLSPLKRALQSTGSGSGACSIVGLDSARAIVRFCCNEADITRSRLSKAATPQGLGGTDGTSASDLGQAQRIQMAASLIDKGDGIYSVWSVRHWGDNRGNPWYSDVTTYGVDPTKFAPQIGGKV